MTTVSRFSRQNDADLRALNVVLWENLLLVVVLVLESNGPYYLKRERDICIKPILGRGKTAFRFTAA